LRKSAFAQTGIDTRELIYVLVPFWRRFGEVSFAMRSGTLESDARLLFESMLTDLPNLDLPAGYTAVDAISALRSAPRHDAIDPAVRNWLDGLTALDEPGVDPDGFRRRWRDFMLGQAIASGIVVGPSTAWPTWPPAIPDTLFDRGAPPPESDADADD
jgi:hypothetical protein